MGSPDRKTNRAIVVFEGDLPEDPGLNRLRRRVIREQGGVIIPGSLTRSLDERIGLPRLSHVPDHSEGPRLNSTPPVTDRVLKSVQDGVAREQKLEGHR